MRIRGAFAAGALGLAVLAAPVSAQTFEEQPAPAEPVTPTIPFDGDPVKVAIATQILDLAMPLETRETTFFATADQIVSQMLAANRKPIDDPAAEAIVQRHLDMMIADMKVKMSEHIPTLMEAWAHSYANMFTKEELDDILAFVETPSGARFFQLSAATIAERNYAAANQAYMNEALETIPAYQERLMTDLFNHFTSKAAEAVPEES